MQLEELGYIRMEKEPLEESGESILGVTAQVTAPTPVIAMKTVGSGAAASGQFCPLNGGRFWCLSESDSEAEETEVEQARVPVSASIYEACRTPESDPDRSKAAMAYGIGQGGSSFG